MMAIADRRGEVDQLAIRGSGPVSQHFERDVFVDRVAFVSFVPKGFASPESLNRVLLSQVGGARLEVSFGPHTPLALEAEQHRLIAAVSLAGQPERPVQNHLDPGHAIEQPVGAQ